MSTHTDPFHILYTDPSEEDDMTDTDRPDTEFEMDWDDDGYSEPMDSAEFTDNLSALILGDMEYDEAFPDASRAVTFKDAGVLTTNDGLVVTFAGGVEFQVTVVRSR